MKTKLQYQTLNKILKSNPSLKTTGSPGYYSDGTLVFPVVWDFAKDKPTTITIKLDGTIK